MKYYLISGEASGDLHAAHLITALRLRDPEATFRFFGGDKMAAAAGDRGTLVRHYRDLAYMGFIPVALHLRTILRGLAQCKRDIASFEPDVIVFVDYAGFNMKIGKWAAQHCQARRVYFIPPKAWAWKEHRVQALRRDYHAVLSILPFEHDWFAARGLDTIYVGNPTADEVHEWKTENKEKKDVSSTNPAGHSSLPTPHSSLPKTLAFLPGSRRQEIAANLPAMLQAIEMCPQAKGYKIVVAAAPGINNDMYHGLTTTRDTYALLASAHAALVTSGTATLETALFRVPQVVCYKMAGPHWLLHLIYKAFFRMKYISLVNLIAKREVVAEVFAHRFSVEAIARELARILPPTPHRQQMLADYDNLARTLAGTPTPQAAAEAILSIM